MRTGWYINCRKCGLPVYLMPHEVKSGRKKFCSKNCLYTSGIQTNTFERGHGDLVPASSRGHTEETKKKISMVQRERNKNRVVDLLAKRDREYKKKIRQSFQWRDWRLAVFERDNYTCQECKARGGYLEPHHIIPVRSNESRLFDITNGITLCRPCHQKTVWKEEQYQDKYMSMIVSQMSAYF